MSIFSLRCLYFHDRLWCLTVAKAVACGLDLALGKTKVCLYNFGGLSAY